MKVIPRVRRFYLVRHGQAEADPTVQAFERDLAGELDPGLSALGRRQATLAAARARQLGAEIVLSSALARARETADVIATRARIPRGAIVPDLNEIAPGDLGALERAVARALFPRANGVLSVWQMIRWLRGRADTETPVAARARVLRVLALLDALPHECVAVVGHGYWITLAAMSLGKLTRPRWVGNCAFTAVDSDGAGRYRIVDHARPIT